MSQKLKVAMVQMASTKDKAQNILRAAKLINLAKKRGAEVVCLPELFNYMGKMDDKRAFESSVGNTISILKDIAKTLGIHIVAGSILIKQTRKLPKNVCFFISPTGKVISSYAKMHLFDIHIPKKITFEESKFMSAGDHATVAKTKFATFGFAICNDLRYPELFRALVKNGAEIIFIPSAFTKFTGKDHWLALTKVRAIENQSYVVAVNQCGENADGVKFFGESVAFDPWGNVVGKVKGEKEGFSVFEIDMKALRNVRKHLPALKKIRPAIRVKASN